MKEFICRFSDDVHDKLREEAFLRKKSMADIVREAMHDYCQHKATNPLKSNSQILTNQRKRTAKPFLQITESCLHKIWDNEEDDFFNDL